MISIIKTTLQILALAVATTACLSKSGSGGEATSSQATEAPIEVNQHFTAQVNCDTGVSYHCVDGNHKACDSHLHGEVWFQPTDETKPVTRDCQWGADVQDIVTMDEEVVCQDGLEISTGLQRPGAIIQMGQCASQPANCGLHTHGENWWVAGSGVKTINRLCTATNGDVQDTYGFEEQFTCQDGVVSRLGERLTSLITLANCGDNQNNCGPHSHGSTWFEEDSSALQQTRQCPNSEVTVNDLYYQFKEMTCLNGVIAPTGTQKLGERFNLGLCPGQLACGNHLDGETWLENVSGEILVPHTCIDGSNTNASYQRQIQKKCVAGVVVNINDQIKGELISVGSCPLNACGQHANGEVWYSVNSSEQKEAIQCENGPFNPPPYNVYSVLQEQICENGQVHVGDHTKRGNKIRQDGVCYQCVPNQARQCNGSISNALYEERCNANGSSYGACTFVSCQSGYAKVGEQCLPIVCQPGSKTTTGCDVIQAGVNEKTCNDTGTAYGQCALRCEDGTQPINGQCIHYSWSATENWSTCNSDCGGAQQREFVCKSNFGQTVAEEFCTTNKPTESRKCDRRASPWEGEPVVSTKRETCSNFGLGYVEKTLSKDVIYSCVAGAKTVSYGAPEVIRTVNKCTDIGPSRCSHDSLSDERAMGRYEWMKKCEDKVPMFKRFFTTIGGSEQLIINPETGRKRYRPLYVTFLAGNDVWKAPAPGLEYNNAGKLTASSKAALEKLSCTVPSNLKVFGVCTSSCYTPDQRLLVARNQQQSIYMPIIEAREQAIPFVMTVREDSSVEKVNLEATRVGAFVTELIDTRHAIRIFHLASGGRLTVTSGHPILDAQGYVREASDFKAGQSFVRQNGGTDKITRIEDASFEGKVYNVMPFTTALLGNIVVAEGYLNGSAYYQNEGVNYINQKILRKSFVNGNK